MTQDEVWLLREKWRGEKSEGFFTDCERLRTGEPLAYVIGYVPFFDTTIYLDTKPLIPRVETEFWVEKAIEEIRNFSRGKASGSVKVLDLCAGSGCIGVAILKALPNVHVDFSEIDVQHHQTIKKNIRENEIDASRTHIMGGNLFESVTDTYDFILTNPPYIPIDAPQTDASVLFYEPHLALFSGAEGLDAVFVILATAFDHLTPNGVMFIEHDPEQCDEINRCVVSKILESQTFPDQYGRSRYTRVTRRGV